jgi:hypothetical protein
VARFNVRKLSELEVKKQYQIEITNRLAALENLNESQGVNRAWENIKGNIRTSATFTFTFTFYFSFLRSLQDYKIHLDMESVIHCTKRSQKHLLDKHRQDVKSV